MQLFVFLSLLLGAALATVTDNHPNVTVYAVSQRDNVKYGQSAPLVPEFNPFLTELSVRPFTLVDVGGKLTAVYVENGFQGLNKFPEYVHSINQGDKYLVVAYPWQLPRNVVDHIPSLDLIASAGHGQVGISQLAQLVEKVSTGPIVLVQSRTENQVIREEQLKEVGTVQITPDGNVQIVRDVVVEHLQDPKYGAFFNPYGFVFQGHNNGSPFNYGYGFPYFGSQTQNSGYGYQGAYPGFTFQAQYPYTGFQGQYPYNAFQGQYPSSTYQTQYPFYGFQGQYPYNTFQGQYPYNTFQGQYPTSGNQEQYNNYGSTVKQSPTFPGYTHNFGYNGFFPGFGVPYFFPTIFGNTVYPFGYNYVSSPFYPGFNSFFLYGQRTPQEETTKAYSGYQYGSYPPFTFYAQQPQYQYGYQGYPFNYYQYYPFSQFGAKSYQNTPYQFQAYQYQPYQFQQYQYQPYQFQQYQPYHFPQYQPFQNQYYQNYQPYYGQYYPQ